MGNKKTTGKQPVKPAQKPTPIGKVIKDKQATDKPKKDWLNCSKCNKAYRTKELWQKHEADCDGNYKGGMPKGYITDDKRLIIEKKKKMQQLIAGKASMLVAAQIAQAVGQPQLWVRKREKIKVANGKGKTTEKEAWVAIRVTTEEDYHTYLLLDHDANGNAKDEALGVEYYYQQGTGNNQALANLLDRAFGKPKESLELGEDPDAPLPKGGTGTTNELRDAFVALIKDQTKAKEPDNAGN